MNVLIETNKRLIADSERKIKHAKEAIKRLDPKDWLDKVAIKIHKKTIRDFKKLILKYELQIKEVNERKSED